MNNDALITSLNRELATTLNARLSDEALLEQLASYINNLINNDFDKLLSLLYRIDVNEAELKKMLQQNPGEDAAKIIAVLLIERQQQKIKTREAFKNTGNPPGEEEKW